MKSDTNNDFPQFYEPYLERFCTKISEYMHLFIFNKGKKRQFTLLSLQGGSLSLFFSLCVCVSSSTSQLRQKTGNAKKKKKAQKLGTLLWRLHFYIFHFGLSLKISAD